MITKKIDGKFRKMDRKRVSISEIVIVFFSSFCGSSTITMLLRLESSSIARSFNKSFDEQCSVGE